MPSEAPAHGDPTRKYLNTKVTGVLLEGMKQLAKDQYDAPGFLEFYLDLTIALYRPNDPLRFLGEYLIQKSRELEGTS